MVDQDVSHSTSCPSSIAEICSSFGRHTGLPLQAVFRRGVAAPSTSSLYVAWHLNTSQVIPLPPSISLSLRPDEHKITFTTRLGYCHCRVELPSSPSFTFPCADSSRVQFGFCQVGNTILLLSCLLTREACFLPEFPYNVELRASSRFDFAVSGT